MPRRLKPNSEGNIKCNTLQKIIPYKECTFCDNCFGIKDDHTVLCKAGTGEGFFFRYICPSCKKMVGNTKGLNNCPYCGRRIREDVRKPKKFTRKK